MTRTTSSARLAAAAGAAGAALLLLAGCAAPRPAAAPSPSPSPASAECPAADQVSALTARAFRATTASAEACAYTTGTARVVVHRSSAGGATLTAERTRAARDGAVVADARDFSFDAFTARDGATCTAWVYGAGGRVTSVAARSGGDATASTCRLATGTAALLLRPAAGEVRTPVIGVVASADALGTAATDRLAAELGAGTGARVDQVDATPSRRGAAAAAALQAAAGRVQPSSKAVVLLPGAADAGRTRLQVLRATTAAIARATRTAPHARIVLVGPVVDGADPAAVLALRDSLSVAAAIDGAAFVDPIAAGWTADDDRLAEAVRVAVG